MPDGVLEHAHDHDGDHSHRYMVHRHRDVTGGTARATVFGVSDGLVSNVALILGVAAAEPDQSSVIIAGVAGLLAGATSMAAGEYVSMKAQSELVERELAIERRSLRRQPDAEIEELAAVYRERGLDDEQAHEMATAVMDDPEVALEVHAREELGVDPSDTGHPVAAAASSFVAFALGALIPLLPWFFGSGTAAIVASSVLGLIATATVGIVLARFTERSIVRTALRQVTWAVVACSATFAIGTWLGTLT
ncbi:VIT1/CCC1 transporter family protein [Ilumatobacter nonamiensis]|uniref:VIT1/CCC1 transporter family protein n=1 Tax=Ilumatobacter nonamiensis TaxID=467093 RepID=UPI00034992BA|nr:VIT1/CCC1 transporter family protein [Ilumatobacter nonamiensis]